MPKNIIIVTCLEDNKIPSGIHKFIQNTKITTINGMMRTYEKTMK